MNLTAERAASIVGLLQADDISPEENSILRACAEAGKLGDLGTFIAVQMLGKNGTEAYAAIVQCLRIAYLWGYRTGKAVAEIERLEGM